MDKPVVDWFGPYRSLTGYGQHMRGMVTNLPDNVDCNIISKGPEHDADFRQEMASKLSELEGDTRNDPHSRGASAIEIHLHNPFSAYSHHHLRSYHNPDIYKILFTVYESPEIPTEWPSLCNKYNEIWCPSEHAKGAFANSEIRDDMKYRVFLEGVDDDFYTPDGEALIDESSYTFLSLFDFTYRKGWDKLIQAYCTEFDSSDDVKLLLKTHHDAGEDFVRSRINAVRSRAPNDPDMELISEWISNDEMPKFYRSGDCFVLPTRGEGFGLPLAEAAACDLPVITTEFYAPTEFLDDNTYWIEVEEMAEYPFEEAIQHEPNCTGLPFAEPSVASLQYKMRKAYYKDDSVDSPDVSDLGWEKPAQQVTDRLKEIWEKHY